MWGTVTKSIAPILTFYLNWRTGSGIFIYGGKLSIHGMIFKGPRFTHESEWTVTL